MNEQRRQAGMGPVGRAVRPWWQNSRVLRALFPPPVRPGDVMEFDDESANPFKNPPHCVIVKATRAKWVSYRWAEGSMWQNESMTRRMFAFCYMKI